MRTAVLLVSLLSLSLPVAAPAGTTELGEPFNQPRPQYLAQQQYQQQLQQQQLQQQQLQQQQLQQQQVPGQQQYQDPQQYQQQLQQQQLQQQQPPQQAPAQQPFQPPVSPIQQQPYQQPSAPQQYQQQYQQPQQYAPQQPYQQPQQYQLPQQGMPAGSPPRGGPCTVKLSADRSTIHMMDSSGGTEQKHVSLGEDRVQKVFNSPDGGWSVAIYKIRGVRQYGFIALDLAKCEEQLPVDVPSMASAAAFDQGEVVLSLEKGEQRFRLKNQVIQ